MENSVVTSICCNQSSKGCGLVSWVWPQHMRVPVPFSIFGVVVSPTFLKSKLLVSHAWTSVRKHRTLSVAGPKDWNVMIYGYCIVPLTGDYSEVISVWQAGEKSAPECRRSVIPESRTHYSKGPVLGSRSTGPMYKKITAISRVQQTRGASR